MQNPDEFYISVAKLVAQNSYSKRKKVGAVLVRDNNILSFGYNGTPYGANNMCEFLFGDGSTKPDVIHAEVNAIAKCARDGTKTYGSVLYCTTAPCMECAKLLIQSGVTEVIFLEKYRNDDGLDLLEISGVKYSKLK